MTTLMRREQGREQLDQRDRKLVIGRKKTCGRALQIASSQNLLDELTGALLARPLQRTWVRDCHQEAAAILHESQQKPEGIERGRGQSRSQVTDKTTWPLAETHAHEAAEAASSQNMLNQQAAAPSHTSISGTGIY